jgi:hypothetical protein
MQEITHQRSLCRRLWPPRSPYLNPHEFYLWVMLKNGGYRSNCCTEDDQEQQNNESVLSVIPATEISRAVNNVLFNVKVSGTLMKPFSQITVWGKHLVIYVNILCSIL